MVQNDYLYFKFNNIQNYVDVSPADGNWHFIDFKLDIDESVLDHTYKLSYDGILQFEMPFNISTQTPTITNMYLGSLNGSRSCEGIIDSFTITDKMNTPQLWTANGAPLILPDFKSEVS